MQKHWSEERIQQALDFAKIQGILKYNSHGKLTHAPFTLSPSPIQKQHAHQLAKLTPIFQKMMVTLANEWNVIEESLLPIASADPFIEFLLSLHARENQQPIQGLFSRNDFLLHQMAPNQFAYKQVEFNTIAAGFPYLASQVNQLHQFLYREQVDKKLIANDPLQPMVMALQKAVECYGYERVAVLMVVQPNESNIFDQRGLELQLTQQTGIPVLRLDFATIQEKALLKEGHLQIGEYLIAVTYYRAGYTPTDFISEVAKEGRRKIEASSTIQIPNLALHLAGTKKIQQVLTKKAVLQQFLSEEELEQVSQSFVHLFAPDEKTTDEHRQEIAVLELAKKHPQDYVLKPQREGGGNNYFDTEMLTVIQKFSAQELQAYILMERIHSPSHPSILVVDHQIQQADCVSEIGRYGIYLADEKEELINQDTGYLVRTKSADKNEGGVSAGYACLDSLFLLEE